MTNREKIIISAYTGLLVCDFSDLHEYIEKTLERPVSTCELTDEQVWNEIKEALKDEYEAISRNKNVINLLKQGFNKLEK